MNDYDAYLARGDLMSHLAEEIDAGRMTYEEANIFAQIPTPVDLIPFKEDNDVINNCYEEYVKDA